MDRFESIQEIVLSPSYVDLHSNMDRFERFLLSFMRLQWQEIYIPIWIDLKALEGNVDGNNANIYIPIWIDLKGIYARRHGGKYHIYIPIWIDLKDRQRQQTNHESYIYIPIWIDLKVKRWEIKSPIK